MQSTCLSIKLLLSISLLSKVLLKLLCVADKCSEHGIIVKSVHQSIVHGSKTPEERTRELLMAVGDQIKTDEQLGEASSESRFNKFVTILEEDLVHKNLAECLRDACSSKGRYNYQDLVLLYYEVSAL